MTEQTIKICGKDVKIVYCAATENVYEDISGKSISVFIPTFDKDGKIVEPAKATIGDFVSLGIAGIIVAYSKDNEDLPIESKEVLYQATPEERNELLKAITELRAEWYGVPKILAEEIKAEQAEQGEQPKND